MEEQYARIARANLECAELDGSVDVVVGPAEESARHLSDSGVEPFDLVFIDADKPNNPLYLDAAMKLSRSGAFIVIDNVVRDGAIIRSATGDPRVYGVRNAIDDVAANPELEATALQTVGVEGWDGLIVARRR